METIEEPSPKTLKTLARSRIISEGLTEKKTWTEISRDLGISRQHLYAELRENPELKNLVIAEITELETQLQDWINQNMYGNNPSNQRTAAQELGKMIRHAKDKAYPTIFRNENININIDIQQIQETNEILKEAVARLPPTIKQHILDNITQIKKEWRIPQ